MKPQIILLRPGTDENDSKSQIKSSISACISVTDIVRSTLGPRGMDKLLVDSNGNTTISNDGATIMKLLEIVHPAAQTLVNIAICQDSIVGDGTTSVVLLAGELLREAMTFGEEGLHSKVIIKA